MPFLKGFSDSPQPKYFDALQRLMKDICNDKFLDSHGCERLPDDIEKKYQKPCIRIGRIGPINFKVDPSTNDAAF
jgi:hypothetical protein